MKNYLKISLVVLSFGTASTFAASKSTATRSLQPIKGEKIHKVVIKVEPDSAVKAYAIEEKIPKECQARQIGTKGNFEKSTSTFKWGVFFDSKTREFSYEVSCTEKAGKLVFAGQASFDGKSIEIKTLK